MKKFFALLITILSFDMLSATAQQTAVQEDLALKYLVQLPAEKTKTIPVIILLHGFGSDEKDLFGLKNFFPKNYLIISARAPYTVASGGYQWYEGTVINGRRDGKKDQLDSSRKLIAAFIPQIIKKYKADAKNVYLIGFSQGAIMSYEAGLTHPESVKGIAILSGMLFNSVKPLIQASPALQRLRIFIAHGTADPRIPFAEGKAANDYLKALGLKTEFHPYDGMGHQINKEVLNDVLSWLK
jgi:phospholipase/carboxylesterase